MRYLLLTVFLLGGVVHAEQPSKGDLHIIAGAWSKHSSSTYLCNGEVCEYNETHDAKGVEYTWFQQDRTRLLVRRVNMDDSRGKHSWTLAGGLMYQQYQRGRFSVETGGYVGVAKHSYLVRGEEATPIMIPAVSVNYGRFGANITAMPKAGRGKSGFVAAEFKFLIN